MNINFVSHLMLPTNGGWNRELVDYVCWPPTARAILAIPLPLQPGEDGFFWVATTDGRYSSKTGYQFICNERLANQASSSLGPSMSASLWNKLWRADAVSTCRETAWRACLDILPVRTELHRRGVAPDPSCPWCLDAPETVEHTLLYCPRLRPMWFASPLGLRFDVESSMQDFLAGFLVDVDFVAAGVLFATFYSVWQARKDFLFRSSSSTLEQILVRASRLRPSRVLAQPPTIPRAPLASSWRKPAICIFNLNFDAALTTSHEAGFGLIARDKEGEILAAATSILEPVLSPIMAEALCFRWALGLASELGFRRVCMETDCLGLFNYWRQREGASSHLETVVRDFRFMLSNFDVFDFSFVRKIGNAVADALAKLAFRLGSLVWIEESS
ncbi:uncharacterized protein LOC130719276 [Lotus japonicus]|uniref:uncharacterized protein LOC130719276 n=1 Tax=Lotus japonicus TaxID=34305 RepID=UPI0025852B52|nr:uncharacterized protein LOC130719276 [Lotus japonicus]